MAVNVSAQNAYMHGKMDNSTPNWTLRYMQWHQRRINRFRMTKFSVNKTLESFTLQYRIISHYYEESKKDKDKPFTLVCLYLRLSIHREKEPRRKTLRTKGMKKLTNPTVNMSMPTIQQPIDKNVISLLRSNHLFTLSRLNIESI